MSYTNQSVSSMADFIAKLNTFVTGTPGWTGDAHIPASGIWAVSKGNVRVAFQWDTSSVNYLAIYQYEGAVWNGGASPWAQNNDSGNGAASTSNASILGQRAVIIGATPLQFWAFEDDNYVHVVVQSSATDYRHFGFGELNKNGSWSGGEYAYGHRTTFTDTAQVSTANQFLLDGLLKDTGSPTLINAEEYAATMLASGLPNQPASPWCVVMGGQSTSNLGTDRAAAARGHFYGGFRGGPVVQPLGARFGGQTTDGFIPMYPIVLFYRDIVAGDIYGQMGSMPDVRSVSIEYFEPADEIVIASDTWVVFPVTRKAPVDSGNSTGYTGFAGIAYKKVTT